MSNILPANRVAALATWAAGLAAFIGSIEGTLPGKWQNAALGIAGVITTLATALHFMTGSQKYDALVTRPAPASSYRTLAQQTEAFKNSPGTSNHEMPPPSPFPIRSMLAPTDAPEQ